MATNARYEYDLNIFGQQPDLHNFYTQISLIYSLPSSSRSRSSTSSTQPHISSNVNDNHNTEDPLVSTLSQHLTNALQRLTPSIPWIAGQVVDDVQAPQGKYKYKIVCLEPTPRFTIKDLRVRQTPNTKLEHPGPGTGLTMKALREAKFPMSMLDENVVAPRNTLMAPGDVCPVFLVQGTIVPSGFEGAGAGAGEGEGEREADGQGNGNDRLILTFVVLHNVMDMTGLGWIVGLLDRLARGGQMTSDEIQLANIDRTGIIKPLDGGFEGTSSASEDVHAKAEVQGGANLREEGSSSLESGNETAPPSPSLRWAYILFPPSSLAKMKALSVSHNTDPTTTQGSDNTRSPIPTFVSTDDVLSAFIFQSIIRARLPRLNLKQNATFARAIDPRRFLNIHPSYPGFIQCMTYTTYPLHSVPDLPLGRIAADLRAELHAPPVSRTSTTPILDSVSSTTPTPATSMTNSRDTDIAHRTCLLAAQISHSLSSSSSEPATSTSVTSSLDLTCDVMLSSWANQSSLWTFDFGLGIGTPESVRRPAFMGVESLCYVMPRRKVKVGVGEGRGKWEHGEGEVVVAVCLRDEDMQRMREDEWVKRWGVWVG